MAMRRRSSASSVSGHVVPACFVNSAKPGTSPSGDVRTRRSESRYTERYAALSRLFIAAMFFSNTARASSRSDEDEDFLEGDEGVGWAGAAAASSDTRARHAAGFPIPFLSSSFVFPFIFTSTGLRVGRGFCGRGLCDAVSTVREAGDRDGEPAADRRFAEQRLNGGDLRDVLSAPRTEVRLEVGEVPKQIGASERNDDNGLAEREELRDRGSPRLRYGDPSQPRARRRACRARGAAGSRFSPPPVR